MARTLALDVGNRRIGVAVSDVSKLIARPLCVLDRKHEDALAKVAMLIAEHQPDEIVIGFPYHADGRVSSQAVLVQQFSDELRGRTTLPVVLADERYTTQDAKHIMAENKRHDQPQHDDAVAAAVILQRYLDERREADAPEESWE